MREITKKSSYAKPQLKTYGGVKQLTLISKSTQIPSDGSYLNFPNPQPAGSCMC